MPLKTAEQLALIYETALTAIVTGKISSYTIGDTSFTKNNIAQLESAYKYWRKLAETEENDSASPNFALADVRDYRNDN